MKLSQNALSGLPANVAAPTYDRSAVTPGILHVGLGNFHRAHQAVYLNDLLNAGGDPSWGIRGAGVRPPDAKMRKLLGAQDYLYTVTQVDGDALNASVIGAMTDFAPVEPENGALIDAMSDAVTRIVSLTVTEGGYFLDADGRFDLSNPAVAADIANPDAPGTVFGAMLAALSRRRNEGTAPFTVMSCDNLPGNGDIARMALLGMADRIDSRFAVWIENNVTFPNGMVDRITPATGDRERNTLKEHFGIVDAYPVFCEPFMQWVLEDNFVNGRPELERVGVTFTDRIHDFEKMKIRILNGGHTMLAYPSALLDIGHVHEAMGTPLILSYLRKVLSDEVLHLIPDVPGFTPAEYLELICGRFANPGVADTIARLCFDGSNKTPKFIVPSIVENLQLGRMPNGLAMHSALWCRYCAGQTEAGAEIAANDPNWDSLQKAARAATADPAAWLRQGDIFGSLAENAAFTAAFSKALKAVEANGTEAAIRAYLRE